MPRSDAYGGTDDSRRAHHEGPGRPGLHAGIRDDGSLAWIAVRSRGTLIRRHEATYCTEILRAAAERGEVPADVDAELVADLARSFSLHEVLVRGARPGRARIAAFVDGVVLPVVSAVVVPTGPASGSRRQWR